jgi:hypothetical protein
LIFYLFLNIFSDSINSKFISFKNNFEKYYSDKVKLIQENKKLKKEVDELNIKNTFSNYFYQRSIDLEKRLNFNNEERSLLSIFNKDKKVFYNYFILKNNHAKKYELGDIAYYFYNFAVGKVIEVDNEFIKIRPFYSYGVEEDYIILDNKNNLAYKANGVGETNGLIKINIPREIELSDDLILILAEDGKTIVAKFLKEDFKSQDTEREVYFKTFYNPSALFEVEI